VSTGEFVRAHAECLDRHGALPVRGYSSIPGAYDVRQRWFRIEPNDPFGSESTCSLGPDLGAGPGTQARRHVMVEVPLHGWPGHPYQAVVGPRVIRLGNKQRRAAGHGAEDASLHRGGEEDQPADGQQFSDEGDHAPCERVADDNEVVDARECLRCRCGVVRHAAVRVVDGQVHADAALPAPFQLRHQGPPLPRAVVSAVDQAERCHGSVSPVHSASADEQPRDDRVRHPDMPDGILAEGIYAPPATPPLAPRHFFEFRQLPRCSETI
jgi:hypothetical protein